MIKCAPFTLRSSPYSYPSVLTESDPAILFDMEQAPYPPQRNYMLHEGRQTLTDPYPFSVRLSRNNLLQSLSASSANQSICSQACDAFFESNLAYSPSPAIIGFLLESIFFGVFAATYASGMWMLFTGKKSRALKKDTIALAFSNTFMFILSAAVGVQYSADINSTGLMAVHSASFFIRCRRSRATFVWPYMARNKLPTSYGYGILRFDRENFD